MIFYKMESFALHYGTMKGALLAALGIAGLDPLRSSPDKDGRIDDMVHVAQPHNITLNISQINRRELHMH